MPFMFAIWWKYYECVLTRMVMGEVRETIRNTSLKGGYQMPPLQKNLIKW